MLGLNARPVGVDGSSGSYAGGVALGRETCSPTRSCSATSCSSAAGSVVEGDGSGDGVYVGGEGSGGVGGAGVGGVGAGCLWEAGGGLCRLGGLWFRCLLSGVIGVGMGM
jgi:hypothetical protein